MQKIHGILPELARPSISLPKLIALVLLIAAIGIFIVLRFASMEEQRDLVQWQNKLNLIADSRQADITGWLEHHFHDLGEVAGNPSLQLYVTELESPRKPVNAMPATLPEDPAQAVFLRNLLLVTADRLGFLGKTSEALKAVRANIHRPAGTGLAIIDNSGKVLVSTEDLVGFDVGLAEKIADVPKGQSALIDLFVSPEGDAEIGFVLPVYPIQGDAVAAQQIGKLVGIKPVGGDLFALLHHPGVTERTLEALLIRKDGDNAVYLSPVKDSKPLATHFALNTPELDAAFALQSPGSFAVKRDRQSHSVLMTSRAIPKSPWILLLHIDRDQALAESDSWRSNMVFTLLFALLAFIASIIAAWWYGTSRRALMLSVQTGRLAAHSVAQEKLLRLVTDNQPEPIFITDSEQKVRFANEKAARLFNIAAEDVTGKELSALMGAPVAKEYVEANKSALLFQKSFARTHRLGEESFARIIRSEHIPLGHIPIDSLPFPSPGVLVVEQDVTEIVNEREKRVRILRQLIDTLVRMVDARDPYAANHSAGVALVARAVAQGLGLERVLVETAETAGNLMNIGKIIVPSEILTKRATLAKDEMQVIRDSLQRSAVVLQGIDFDGPVSETLRQAPERFDGTGPLAMKGEHILVTARIIAVANSFIGMISPRSYRAAISIEQATTTLLQNIDTQFDRRIVVALINFIENKQGREVLAGLLAKKI